MIAFIGDLHITNRRVNDKGDCVYPYIDSLIDKVVNRGINKVFFTGDIFDHEHSIEIERQFFVSILQKYENINFYTISGNHDTSIKKQYGVKYPVKDSLNTTAKSHDNFRVIDYNSVEPNYVEIGDYRIYGIPYFDRESNFVSACKDISDSLDNAYINILIIHQNIFPHVLFSEIKPDADYFKKFNFVIAGHIHQYKEYGSFYIIGSALTQTKSDLCANGKRVLFLDNGLIISEILLDDDFYISNSSEEGFDDSFEASNAIHVDKAIKEPKRSDMLKSYFASDYDFNFFNSLIGNRVIGISEGYAEVKFIRLDLEGVGTYIEPQSIDLSYPGFTWIRGDQGSGKTTIHRAIQWCLEGRYTVRDKAFADISTAKHLRPDKFSGTRVKLYLDVNAQQYVIYRHKNYAGLTLGDKGINNIILCRVSDYNDESTYEIIDLDSLYVGEFDDLQAGLTRNTAKVLKMLGLNSTLIRYTLVVSPDAIDYLGMSQDQIRDVVESMINMDAIDYSEKKLKNIISELESNLASRKKVYAYLEQNVKQLNVEKMAEEENYRNFNANISSKIKQAEDKISKIDTDISLLEKEIKEKDSAIVLDIKLIDKYEYNSLQAEHDRLCSLLSIWDSIENKDVDYYQNNIDIYNNLTEVKRKIDSDIKNLEDQIVKVNKIISDTNKVKYKAKADLGSAENSLKLLQETPIADRCNTCGASLSTEKIKELNEHYHDNIIRLNKIIFELGVDITDCDTEMERLQRNLIDLTQKKDALLKQLPTVDYNFFDYSRKTLAKINDINTIGGIDLLKNKVASIYEQLVELGRIDAIHKANSVLRSDIELLKYKAESASKQKLLELSELNKIKLGYSLDKLNYISDSLFIKEKELNDERKHIEGLTSELDYLIYFKKKYLCSKCVKVELGRYYIDVINSYLSSYSKYIGIDVRIVNEEGNYDFQYKTTDGKDIVVPSKGWTAIINLIILGALVQFRNTYCVNISNIFIDEPFSTVPEKNIHYIQEILQKIKTFSNVASFNIITHAKEVDLSNANIVDVIGGLQIDGNETKYTTSRIN